MRIAAAAALIALVVPAFAIPPVPRPSKEFTFVEASGKQTLLTDYKGKVVIIQFLFTWCPHCKAFSQTLTKLQKELGPKGVQMLGVAFNDDDPKVQLKFAVPQYISENNVGFPVTISSSVTVRSYLGLSVMDRLAVPQIMIIDKTGVIRAQSEPLGSSELQNEDNLRRMLTDLARGVIPKLPPKVVERNP